MTRTLFLTTALVAVATSVAMAQAPKKEKKTAPDNYDAVVAKYLETARQLATASAPAPDAWISNLLSDRRARNVNDLVTVRVVESTTAAGSADASLGKKSGASTSATNLLGMESKLPSFIDPTNLATVGTDTKFNGSGTVQRSGTLSAIITARVAEVLPNGDLVLEGIREVEINGDRQIVVLTGVARAQDVGPGNVLPSQAIGQLRIRYFGKGLMKDSLSPGWLVRFINKIF